MIRDNVIVMAEVRASIARVRTAAACVLLPRGDAASLKASLEAIAEARRFDAATTREDAP